MNHETELKIQAHVDGELPDAEKRRIAELIHTDAEARALFESLSATRTMFAANEPQYTLPETREFYWSKIEREIRRQTVTQERVAHRLFGWNRWWLRLGVPFATAAMVLAVILINSHFGGSLLTSQQEQGIEAPLEEASSITFQSDAENMTVVWVQTR